MVSVLLSASFKDSIYNNRWQKTAELHAALKSDEQREREWKESWDKKKTFFCELWGTLSVNFRIPSSGYIQHKSHYHSTMVSFPQLIESFVKNCGGNAFLLPVIFVSYLSCHQIETESPLISLILYCSHKMNAFLAGSEFQRNNVSYGLFVIMESDFRSPVPQSYAGPWQPPAPVAPCSRQRWVFLTAAHGDPEHSAALLESGTPSRADGCSCCTDTRHGHFSVSTLPQLRGNAAKLRPLSFCYSLMALTLLQDSHQENISCLKQNGDFPFHSGTAFKKSEWHREQLYCQQLLGSKQHLHTSASVRHTAVRQNHQKHFYSFRKKDLLPVFTLEHYLKGKKKKKILGPCVLAVPC